MKHLLFVIALIMSLEITAQENKEWIFCGLLLQENVGCSNPAFTKYAFKWIEKNNNQVNNKLTYENTIDEYVDEFKIQNSTQEHPYVSKYMVRTTGDTIFIALVEKHRKCSNGKIVNNLGFYRGRTQELLKKSIESDISLYKNEILDYDIVRIWNTAEEYEKLVPHKRVVELSDDFGGVKAVYKYYEFGGKDGIYAKFKNTTQNKLALLLVRENGKMTSNYLEPGNTISQKYSGISIEVQVIYQDYKAPKSPDSAIDFIKDKIRKVITIKDGEINKKEIKSSAIGVRG